MKFICETETLSQACQNVLRAVSSKTSIPAVECILIKAIAGELNLTGYDLELGINTSIKAKVEEAGNILINARILCDILKKLPGEMVSIEADERQLARITSGEANYSIMGMSADEYPELPSVTGGSPIVIQQGILKEMVRQTIFAVAVNDTKIVHTGIKIEVGDNILRLIAVDGFRLAIRKENIIYDGTALSFVVPAKTLSEVVKLISDEKSEISLGVGKKHIVFEIGGYSVVSRLLEGDFLNYKSAIPSTSTTSVRVNTRALIESIERTSLIISDKITSPVRCLFNDNTIKISSSTAIGTATDKIGANISGDSVEIGFNNRFLLDALRVSDTDEVKIDLNGAVSPILILPPENDCFIFLILPVRLKAE
ncbi:MAG: DNA polymerase III subunit beta [Eubacteriales bacterium]